jgi:ATP-dependent DNA ligase
MKPKQIYPMLAKDNPYEDPFIQPGYILQEKYDGTRVVAIKEFGRWYLMTRKWKSDITHRFPDIVRELDRIRTDDVILDGELTFFKRGKVKFLSVLARPETKEDYVAKYMVFDVTRYNGDITQYPLLERVALLHKIIPAGSRHVQIVKTIKTPSDFRKVYKTIVKGGGEGVVMKKKDSPYVFDSREHWIKVKKTYTEDCIVVGITYGTGKRQPTFGALLLAQYDNKGQLKLVGKTSGFDDRTLLQLYNGIMRMPAQQYPAFRMSGVKKWVAPVLVVEVRYTEKTPYGILRHPVFMRLRDDKSPSQCRIRR